MTKFIRDTNGIYWSFADFLRFERCENRQHYRGVLRDQACWASGDITFPMMYLDRWFDEDYSLAVPCAGRFSVIMEIYGKVELHPVIAWMPRIAGGWFPITPHGVVFEHEASHVLDHITGAVCGFGLDDGVLPSFAAYCEAVQQHKKA